MGIVNTKILETKVVTLEDLANEDSRAGVVDEYPDLRQHEDQIRAYIESGKVRATFSGDEGTRYAFMFHGDTSENIGIIRESDLVAGHTIVATGAFDGIVINIGLMGSMKYFYKISQVKFDSTDLQHRTLEVVNGNTVGTDAICHRKYGAPEPIPSSRYRLGNITDNIPLKPILYVRL